MKDSVKLQNFRRSFRTKWKYVLWVVPSLFLLVLFQVYPNVAIFPMSLYEWSPIKTVRTFVGTHNFDMLFTVNLEDTLEITTNTLLYIGGLFVVQTLLALVLALALQKNTRKNRFFRAYFFLPMVFSATMISMTWNYMYDPNLGVINTFLGMLGVDGYPGVNLMDAGWKAILLIVFVHIWANIGYPLIIITSGLNTISGELGEAAMVDGANSWQTFTKITFPLLMPTLFRLSLMTITTGAMAANYIVMMGTRHSQTWSSYIYNQTRGGTDYGSASAAAVLLFVFLAIASAVQFFAMRKIENKVLG